MSGGTCLSYSGNGIVASANGVCNSDGTITGTLYGSSDCTGTNTAAFANVASNTCSSELSLTENGQTVYFYAKATCAAANGAASTVASLGAVVVAAGILLKNTLGL